MKKQFRTVAVLMGGIGSERDVSLRSGAAIARGLRERGYEVAEVDVKRRRLDLPAGTDAAFVALHGAFGEDGGIQRLLARRGVPYTGSDAASCRVAFDKKLTRKALAAAGIPIAEGVTIRRAGAASPLPLPVVVKPTREGSSVGCHRVRTARQWARAAADALKYNGEAVVEDFIEGRELTVGIVGGRALPAVEIVAPGGEYSYKAKYTPGMTRYICPARIPVPLALKLAACARAVFRVLGASGMGRVDFRLRPDGTFCVLELNSIPGFTETSLLPKAAAAAGLDFGRLCERILNLAIVP